jgi:hypothetical protein
MASASAIRADPADGDHRRVHRDGFAVPAMWMRMKPDTRSG